MRKRFTDSQRLQFVLDKHWLGYKTFYCDSGVYHWHNRNTIDAAMRESIARKQSRKRKKK